jgi:hypothetical protein
VVVTGGVAGLSDRHSQGCGVQRHLGDKRGTAATGGLVSRVKPLGRLASIKLAG